MGEDVASVGLVISKDSRSDRVHALSEHNAENLWTIETDDHAMIAHADDRHVYMLGERLVAHDLRTGEAVWWTPHHGKSAGKPVFTQETCLIAGNDMLCKIELSTGRLTAINEVFIGVADLAVFKNHLVRVTEDRITAFRMSDHKTN